MNVWKNLDTQNWRTNQALLLKQVEATKLEKAKSWAMWLSLRGEALRGYFFFCKVMGKNHQR